VQQSFVEPRSPSEVGQALDAVVVVADEHDQRSVMLPPALDLECDIQGLAALPQRGQRHAEEGNQPIAGLLLRIVDEARVHPERHVVQEDPVRHGADIDPLLGPLERSESRNRVGHVEAQVSREVVPRPERDAGEGQLALEGDGRDRTERTVPTRDAERARAGSRRLPRQVAGVVVLAEDVRADAPALRLTQ
jgi:hypothetical protein